MTVGKYKQTSLYSEIVDIVLSVTVGPYFVYQLLLTIQILIASEFVLQQLNIYYLGHLSDRKTYKLLNLNRIDSPCIYLKNETSPSRQAI